MRPIPAVVSCALISLAAAPASAIPVWGLVLYENDQGIYYNTDNPGALTTIEQPDGSWLVLGTHTSENTDFTFQVRLKAQGDLVLQSDFTLANRGFRPFTEYRVELTLATNPVTSPSAYQCNYSGTLTDSNPTTDPGATLSAFPFNLYTAFADLNLVESFYPRNSFITINEFGVETAPIPPVAASGPNGPAVENTIAIINSFALTMGDTVQMNSLFTIGSVPTPGVGACLVPLLALASRRKRPAH